ncbi:MAG: hypothetical protein KIT83_15140 [Bryobacterales bacterium]|nr:hypothetical protein [Bryobacterales bacterium]
MGLVSQASWQADDVLQVSANLTEYQKLSAELFDNKIRSLGFSAVFAALSQGLGCGVVSTSVQPFEKASDRQLHWEASLRVLEAAH